MLVFDLCSVSGIVICSFVDLFVILVSDLLHIYNMFPMDLYLLFNLTISRPQLLNWVKKIEVITSCPISVNHKGNNCESRKNETHNAKRSLLSHDLLTKKQLNGMFLAASWLLPLQF